MPALRVQIPQVKNAKGALEEKSQEKRSLMTALEHVHSETQNQEYARLNFKKYK